MMSYLIPEFLFHSYSWILNSEFSTSTDITYSFDLLGYLILAQFVGSTFSVFSSLSKDIS